MKMNAVVTSLVKLYKYPILGKLARLGVLLFGADVATGAQIRRNVQFPHNAVGSVIPYCTVLEDNVVVFGGVTLGDASTGMRPFPEEFEGWRIKKGAILCAGAKLMSKGNLMVIGENTVVGANAVLLTSTGDNEIWAGVPARKIGVRD
jgi:serine O-acetyltransferase